jgi:multiple sugar transport system substrate-binding protein
MEKNTKIIVIGVGAFLILGLVALFYFGAPDETGPKYKVSLEIWGPLDDSSTYRDIFDTYRKINPNITKIQYKKINYDTYKEELKEALAAGQGPDIILIKNTWLPSFSNKITPASPEIISEQVYRKNFVDVCANDFVSEGKVWAVPLSVDSLALYYNKDLFNEAGIVSPPTTWEEFKDDVEKLTKTDNTGEISTSGTALGTAYNINRATEVLTLLMFQNGTDMSNMDSTRNVDGVGVNPAVNAIDFYTQFSKKNLGEAYNPYYCWNPNMHNSVDAFSEGALGMMFNYSWQIGTIKSKAPKLNFAVAPVPQFTNGPKANHANYWAFAVLKSRNTTENSKNVTNDVRIAEAWNFLTFLTTKPDKNIPITIEVAGQKKTIANNYDPAENYISNTKVPAARRDLIETQKSDTNLGVFAIDNLIAKSWKQNDPDATEAIFSEMIDQINRGQTDIRRALSNAAARINKLKPN